jgi:hypothetical protein
MLENPKADFLRVAPVPPRKGAALLSRPARRGVLNLSGRRASRQLIDTPAGRRTKGVCKFIYLPTILES